MLRLDSRLESWIVAHRLGALDPVARALTFIGTDGAVWLVLALLLALLWRKPRLAVAVALADLVADLTTTALQALIGRRRPDVPTLVSRPHSYSFPSGHAATSFACAVVLGSFVPRLRVPALLLAAAIAWSRLYVGVHYPLDVAAGALYGAAVGLAVLRGLPRLAECRRRSRRARRSG
jgi:undecaprenyl-diphosphatase